MLLDVVPYLFLSPRDKRINLNELVHGIPLHDLHILTGNTLFTTQSTDPCIETFEGTLQWFQFSNLAATMPTLYGVVEKVDALFLHHTLHFVIVWEKHFQLDSIRQVRLVDERYVSGKSRPVSSVKIRAPP